MTWDGKHLEREDRKELADWAIQNGLAGKRNQLMRDIDPTLSDSIKEAEDRAGQLRNDLEEINKISALPDGQLPIMIWLDNAEDLVHSVEDKELLKQFTEIVSEKRRKHEAEAEVATPPGLPGESGEQSEFQNLLDSLSARSKLDLEYSINQGIPRGAYIDFRYNHYLPTPFIVFGSSFDLVGKFISHTLNVEVAEEIADGTLNFAYKYVGVGNPLIDTQLSSCTSQRILKNKLISNVSPSSPELKSIAQAFQASCKSRIVLGILRTKEREDFMDATTLWFDFWKNFPYQESLADQGSGRQVVTIIPVLGIITNDFSQFERAFEQMLEDTFSHWRDVNIIEVDEDIPAESAISQVTKVKYDHVKDWLKKLRNRNLITDISAAQSEIEKKLEAVKLLPNFPEDGITMQQWCNALSIQITN